MISGFLDIPADHSLGFLAEEYTFNVIVVNPAISAIHISQEV